MTMIDEELRDSATPPARRERLKIIDERMIRNERAIRERIGPEREREFKARAAALANSREPAWIRLRDLYALAEEMLVLWRGNIACRQGCTHCCHIPLAITSTEAEMLGSALKRKPRGALARRNYDDFNWGADGYANPCPFLKNGSCSIYEQRPLPCRVHVSIDDDPLLCEISPTKGYRMPYLDMDWMIDAYLKISGPHRRVADIRDFFPTETAK